MLDAVACFEFPLVHEVGYRQGLNREEKVCVSGHHDVSRQYKRIARAEVAKEGQNQVSFG